MGDAATGEADVDDDARRSHELLSPQDATLLCATAPNAQIQIGALCFFEAAPLRDRDGAIRLDDVRSQVESRLHLAPRFRRRVARIPFDAARPAWIDDDEFDVTHHVRATTLPAPGGTRALRGFCAELLSTSLDVDRPLWDICLVDGVDEERIALVLRVHHVMADGLSLLDAALLLLDPEPHDSPGKAVPWIPKAAPTSTRLLVSALAARSRHQFGIGAATLQAIASMADPRTSVGLVRSVAGVATSSAKLAPATRLNSPVGHKRDFLWSRLSMPELLDLRTERGTTLNDVVLAVVTGALRRHLGPDESDRLVERPPRVLVPVGSSREPISGHAGNTFSMMLASLPIWLDDPLAQLDEIHAQMEEKKRQGGVSVASSLFSLIDVVPPTLLRCLGPPALARQPLVNLAVTNIPGSRSPSYLLGSEMLQLHPIVTGVGNIALIVGVLSYVNDLGVGVTVDPDVVADPEGFIADLAASCRDLVSSRR